MNSQTGQTKVSSSTKKTVLVLIVIAALLPVLYFLFSGGREEQPSEEPRVIGVGDKAPDFTLTGLDGKQVRLSDFAGKVVLVHFWATWCPPCVDEIPTINRLWSQLPTADFAVLAISVDEGGQSAVGSFMQRNRLTMPILLDPRHSVSSRYGTFKFPETYVVGRDGVVKYKIIGPRDWNDPETLPTLKQLAGR